MTEIELLVGVVQYIAGCLGEDPACTPSTTRRLAHCQIAVSLLSEACGNDPASIIAVVTDIVSQPSIDITIDSA